MNTQKKTVWIIPREIEIEVRQGKQKAKIGSLGSAI